MVKKELVRRFPFEDFVWIDDIFLEEGRDEGEQEKEKQVEDNSAVRASVDVIENTDVIETREEEPEDPPM